MNSDRADRDVDADAERVGAADDLQQPGLGQRLDEPAVARQHAGVMHADADAYELRQRLAERRGEPEVAEVLGLDAELHVCRTICRRAERLLVSLARSQSVPEEALTYLNRLSDAFLVLEPLGESRSGHTRNALGAECRGGRLIGQHPDLSM